MMAVCIILFLLIVGLLTTLFFTYGKLVDAQEDSEFYHVKWAQCEQDIKWLNELLLASHQVATKKGEEVPGA